MPISDKEFERLAVLHAMGALSEEEAQRFQLAREERGQQGEQLVRGVERSLGPAGAGAASTVPAERADLTGVTGRPLRSERPLGWIAAVAALTLALAAAIGYALSVRGGRTDLVTERETATARAESLAAVVATRDSALATIPRAAEIAPVLAAPDAVVTPLSGPGGSGRLLAADVGALFAARELPPLDTGGSYTLWRVGPAGVEPIAPLGRAPDGLLLAIFGDAAFLEGAGAIRVTAETDPEAGRPRGPVMLEGFPQR